MYDELDKTLWNFIISQQTENNQLLELIQNYYVGCIFCEKLKSINLEEYYKYKNTLELQEINYQNKKKEILLISRKFSEKNIKVIHLKGISLAMDIYEHRERVRKSNDIDILISTNQIDTSLDILGGLNYYVKATNEKVSSKIKERYLDEVVNHAIHFPEFIKHDGDVITKMDCHISIVHEMDNKIETMQNIIERAITQIIDGQKIYVLEIHDRILHLAIHLAKEFFRNSIRWLITGERKLEKHTRISLALIHDIALLIKKYKHSIDWEIIYNRAKQMDVLEELFSICCILDQIYPELEVKVLEDDFNNSHFEKEYGMLYPLYICIKHHIKYWEMNLVEISERILYNTKDICKIINTKQVYNLCEQHSNPFISGCGLYQKAKNPYCNIEFETNYIGNNIKLKLANMKRKCKKITFILGFEVISPIIKSYIHKISIIYDEIKEIYLVHIANAYISIILNDAIEESQDSLKIELPFSLFCDKKPKITLVDIEIPELYKEIGNNTIRKGRDNDIGQKGLSNVYPFSPFLLTQICDIH